MKAFLVIMGLVFLVNGCYRKEKYCISRLKISGDCFSLQTNRKDSPYYETYFTLSCHFGDCNFIVLYEEKNCTYPPSGPVDYPIDYYDKIVFTTKFNYNQTYKAGDTINAIVGDIRYEYWYLKEFEEGKCHTIPPCDYPLVVKHYYNTFQQMMNDQKDTARVGNITFRLLEPPDSVRNFNIYMHIRFKDGRKFTISLPQDIIIRPN